MKSLGNKKVKVMRERKNGEVFYERNLDNIDEDELDHFNKKFEKKAKKYRMPRMN